MIVHPTLILILDPRTAATGHPVVRLPVLDDLTEVVVDQLDLVDSGAPAARLATQLRNLG
jgi:hypothetical protein